jgi:hypothetical protein
VVRKRAIERLGTDQSGRAGDQQRCHLAGSIMAPRSTNEVGPPGANKAPPDS